jgi:3-oxoadipate enol-lactonase
VGGRLALLIDDVRLNYKVEGKGECITLIHGIGGTLHDFDPIAGKLAERFRVLRYDQRGFGGSDKPLSRPYTNEL